MAQTAKKTAKSPAARTRTPAARTRTPAKKGAAAQVKPAVDKSAELSAEMFQSIEAAQRRAIEAVRKFVDTVDEALPAIGGRPSRRETVIDAALAMADKLVATQYEFLRNVVRNADRTLTRPSARTKG